MVIINYLLFFLWENMIVFENEEEIICKMQVYQEKLQLEQLCLEEEVVWLVVEKEVLEQVVEEGRQQNEICVVWDFWSIFCMIFFLMIEVWWQDYQEVFLFECLGGEEDELFGLGGVFLQGFILFNKVMFGYFYECCIWGVMVDVVCIWEFLEGFVDDLLEVLRSFCNWDIDMEVEDFIGVDSMYENWQVDRLLLCYFFVFFIFFEFYCFYLEFWCFGCLVFLDCQGYGQIKVVCVDGDILSCICGKIKFGEDMLCFLYGRNSMVFFCGDMENLLCVIDFLYLDMM